MKVKLEKSYPMPGGADAAWAVLGDIERVALCMPGAQIAERVDDSRYKGTVAVRFGPANLTFRGEVQVTAREDAARRLALSGKGTDTTGGSGASMDLDAHIEPGDAASCSLVGVSEVSMSGKAAAFGSRLAGPLADQVLKQFAENFALQVRAEQAARTAVAPPSVAEGPVSSAPPAQPEPDPRPAAASSLNGFALLWSLVKSWWRGLLGRGA